MNRALTVYVVTMATGRGHNCVCVCAAAPHTPNCRWWESLVVDARPGCNKTRAIVGPCMAPSPHTPPLQLLFVLVLDDRTKWLVTRDELKWQRVLNQREPLHISEVCYDVILMSPLARSSYKTVDYFNSEGEESVNLFESVGETSQVSYWAMAPVSGI